MSKADLKRADDAVNGIRPQVEEWRVLSVRWRMAHYVIGISALALSALVAASGTLGHFPAWFKDFIPYIAAVCTGVLTFLSPLARSNKYSRAWSATADEILKYDVDHETAPQDVMRAFRHGVDLLNDETPREFATDRSSTSRNRTQQ